MISMIRTINSGAPMSILSNVRNYLLPSEIERLIKCASPRNGAMILLAYRHGLRVSELVNLEWSQIDLHGGTIHVHRRKHGVDSTHPLSGSELRALRRLRREHPNTRHVFISQRGTPMTRQNVQCDAGSARREAGIEIAIHRTCCGTQRATSSPTKDGTPGPCSTNLGHRNIQSTVIYTNLDGNRFNGWWQD